MPGSVDELTVEVEENGIVVVKETGKTVLSKGAWATVMFRYQEWNPDTGAYGPQKYVVRRYKKWGGEYRQQSKFSLSSDAQARRVAETLLAWLAETDGKAAESE